MNSIKCKNCGLKNFSSETECRRCGLSLLEIKKRKERRPSRFSVWSLLPIVVALGFVYYFYNGVQGTMEQINTNEAQRIDNQPAERPASPGQSRTKYDQQRSGHYGDAVRNSPGLKAHENRTRETEKTVQQLSNSSSAR